MLEAKTRSAVLDDVDEQDFIRLCQFAYMGDYTTPLPIVESSEELKQEDAAAPADPMDIPPAASPAPEGEPAPEPPMDDPQGQEVPAEAPREEIIEEIFEPVPEFFYDSRQLGSSKSKKKKESRRVKFRQAFENKTPCPILPRQPLLDSCEPGTNSDERENYTTVFLAHCRLYVLADRFGIETLRALTLWKLHETLVHFTLYETRVPDIVELIEYAYSNTPDYCSRVDDLRSLVSEYAVCEIDTLGRSPDFVALMEEGGPFIRDWWKLMRECRC